MSKKEKLNGKDKFEQYYSEVWAERWKSLKNAMLEDSNPVLLSEHLSSPYYMDRASITAASMLPVKQGDSVLDMCAAPGGKTLVLAMKLNGTGALTSNDRSASRRNRLISVINSCLPEELKKNIKVTGYDSSKWSLYEKDAYDCILLDAPCSSERHVLNDESALSIWGTNRPKVLSIQQFAMLAAALDVVRTNGYILYSTCSVNPMENQNVISKLYSKRAGRFEECIMNLPPEAEKLEHGAIILPDKANGTGPLYFCLIRRIS